MSDTAEMGRKREGPPGRRPLADDELADQLLGKAQAEGADLLGPDGLLSQVSLRSCAPLGRGSGCQGR
jgi:hypothetical protein